MNGEEIHFGAAEKSSAVLEQNMELIELSHLSYDPCMETQRRREPYPEIKAYGFLPQKQTFQHNSSFIKMPEQCLFL